MSSCSRNIASAITKLVAFDALQAVVENLVIGNLVSRDYEPVEAMPGDAIQIPVEGNAENACIVLGSHIEATFLIPDVTKVLAVPDLLQIYMQPAVLALTERIETDLLGLAYRFTWHRPIVFPEAELPDGVIDYADVALLQGNVPADAVKYLVVNPGAYGALRDVPGFMEFRSASEAGLRQLVRGPVGKIKDFFIFRSPFVNKSGNHPVFAHSLAFTKDAIGLVARRPPKVLPDTGAFAEYAEMGNFGIRVVLAYNPNSLAQQVTIDVLHGVGVLRDNHGVLVIG